MKKAIIFWLTEAEGGRKKPPMGAEYYPTIQLDDGSTWSVAIKFNRNIVKKDDMVDECEACFLFEHSPQHILESNAEFFIYEGPHKVGSMVIR